VENMMTDIFSAAKLVENINIKLFSEEIYSPITWGKSCCTNPVIANPASAKTAAGI
jgi:hypothetical protein